MRAEVHGLKSCEVSIGEARVELARLLADDRFRLSDRQRALLSYLAERRFDGHSEGVKAYVIALDVLGRPCGFDAINDPIVRIEISRLRATLESYYKAFGEETEAWISIPKGQYIALFPRRAWGSRLSEVADDRPLEEGNGEGIAASDVVRGPRRRLVLLSSLAAVMTVGVLAAVAIIRSASIPGGDIQTSRPIVFVSMEAANAELENEAKQTSELLVAALTQFRTLVVAKSGYVSARDRERGRRYEIDLKYYGEAGSRSVWWQIVDRNGDVLRSGVERTDSNGRSPISVQNSIVTSLAGQFASTRGIINNIEVHESPEGALGNACILRVELALDTGNPAETNKYRPCLERTLAAAPTDSDAMALMARVTVAGEEWAIDKKIAAMALDLAKRAVILAPLSDRAQTALMVAQFANGQPDAAIEAGNRTVDLNPNNADAAAKLAMILYTTGYADAGVAVARDAGHAEEGMFPRDAMIVLALDAYNAGKFSEASLLAEQISHGDFLVCSLRAAALAQLNSKAASDRLKDLRTWYPDFDSQFHTRIIAKGLPGSVVSGLEAGLIKAGASFPEQKMANASP